MSDNKQIAKNTMFLYFRMFLILGVSLYTSRIILIALGVEDFGIYNVIGGIVTMFSFLYGSLSAATSRYIIFELGRKNNERLNQVFNTALVVHILLALLIVVLAETVGLWFFYTKMTIPSSRMTAAFWVYQISIITSVVSLTQVPYGANIIARENMKIYAYVGMVEVLLKLAVVYLILISPIDKLVFYAFLIFCVQITSMMYYHFYCVKHYPESHIKLCKDKQLYKDIFAYAGLDMIGNASVMLQGQGINLLLNVFYGPVVNAARAIAFQVQGAVTQFSNNFMTAVKPQIIKKYAEGNIEAMLELVENCSCFSYYLMWMISLPICLEAKFILGLWLGDYPEHTVIFTKLVLILCLIQTLKTPRSTIFHATGKLKTVNLVVGGILCAAFPLAYLFLKLGGAPESVFWAVNVTMLFSEIASIIILKRYINYSAKSYILRVHGRCLLVSLLSFIIPFLLYNRFAESSILRMMITCMYTTLSVGLVSFFIGMDKNMRLKLISIVKNKISKA